jgi:hypothetical protein
MAGQPEALRLFPGHDLPVDLSRPTPARLEEIARSEASMAAQKYDELMRSPEKLRALGMLPLTEQAS